MNKKPMLSLKLTGIALAVGQAFAPHAFAQTAEPSTVVVTGIRASAQSSVAIKKNTMEIVDSITAEDIGKLPDPNVAETMTRIPGVQGYRYGGEGASPFGSGSGLAIRGLGSLTASQVNGRAYFTAGSREFNIEDAIPGMIAGVDVYKNPSAEHVEGAIGGLVNIRTRNPSDFKGFTAALNGNVRYNDLEKKYDPELFGLVANRFDLGGGSRIGVMAAFAFQKSAARSDSAPSNRGIDYRRVVRANSAEYASMAAANTGNSPILPMSAYVGRSDISFLAPVTMRPASATVGANTPDTTGLTPDQVSNIITTPGTFTNIFQESIKRERKGLSLGADYRVDNTLRFYIDGNYTHYLYHQNYRFIFVDQGAGNPAHSGNVRNLQTTPFSLTETLANRNLNGGSDDVLSSQRFLSGTFMNASLRPWGGDEHSPYTTWNTAAGAEWSPTPALSLKADFSYIKADRRKDNRRVEMAGAAGRLWEVTRLAQGEPSQISFNGPSLTDPSNFVYSKYDNGGNEHWDDKGHASVLSGAYIFDEGFLSRLKFGLRHASQQDLYKHYGYSRWLTTNGTDLAANRSNGLSVATNPAVLELAPNNFMDGKTGFPGGYLVYSPNALLGNQVRDQFPNAGIPLDGAIPENMLNRRGYKESTTALWLSGDFSAIEDRLKGNLGVRVVRTRSKAFTNISNTTTTPASITQTSQSTSYTNVLPSLNVSYELSQDFLARFGYGRGMTRPDPGALNPFIDTGAGDGSARMGNPDLRPQVADSFDLSLERYFTATNYTSVAVFRKNIDGFFNTLADCMTVPFRPAYTGATPNGCSNGQYMVSRQLNAEKGWVRGVEVAGQWFFDAKSGWLQNFGVSGSFTYVDTANPINMGTARAPRVVTVQQPFVSKRSYSVSGLYEDKKLSGRLIYTWRSPQQLGNVGMFPMNSSYVEAYGLLDASVNYAISDKLTVSFNASNITDKGLNRFIGEANTYETGREHQHFVNGRTFSLGMRYKF